MRRDPQSRDGGREGRPRPFDSWRSGRGSASTAYFIINIRRSAPGLNAAVKRVIDVTISALAVVVLAILSRLSRCDQVDVAGCGFSGRAHGPRRAPVPSNSGR